MVRQILRFSHHKICKVYLAIFNFIHQNVTSSCIFRRYGSYCLDQVWILLMELGEIRRWYFTEICIMGWSSIRYDLVALANLVFKSLRAFVPGYLWNILLVVNFFSTRNLWRLKHLRAEAPPWSQHLAKFSGYKYCESGSTDCSNYHMNSFWSRDQRVMWL